MHLSEMYNNRALAVEKYKKYLYLFLDKDYFDYEIVRKNSKMHRFLHS